MFKNHRFMLTAVVLAAFFSGPLGRTCADTQGQQMRSGPGRQIAKALSLTDAQKALLEPILEGVRGRFKSIHDDQSLSHQEKKRKFEALMAEINFKIDKILTPAQQKELAILRQKMRRDHWHDHPPQ